MSVLCFHVRSSKWNKSLKEHKSGGKKYTKNYDPIRRKQNENKNYEEILRKSWKTKRFKMRATKKRKRKENEKIVRNKVLKRFN